MRNKWCELEMRQAVLMKRKSSSFVLFFFFFYYSYWLDQMLFYRKLNEFLIPIFFILSLAVILLLNKCNYFFQKRLQGFLFLSINIVYIIEAQSANLKSICRSKNYPQSEELSTDPIVICKLENYLQWV